METLKSRFDTLFDKNYQAVCLYVSRFVGNREEVEDIVQSTFLKLWETMKTKPGVATRGYLYTMARNAVIDRSRHHKIQIVDLESVSPHFEAFFQPDSDNEATVDIILAAINDLPERARRIVTEVFVEGRKYQEVADGMGISLNTVKTQLGRSLHSLRKGLDGKIVEILLTINTFLR